MILNKSCTTTLKSNLQCRRHLSWQAFIANKTMRNPIISPNEHLYICNYVDTLTERGMCVWNSITYHVHTGCPKKMPFSGFWPVKSNKLAHSLFPLDAGRPCWPPACWGDDCIDKKNGSTNGDGSHLFVLPPGVNHFFKNQDNSVFNYIPLIFLNLNRLSELSFESPSVCSEVISLVETPTLRKL